MDFISDYFHDSKRFCRSIEICKIGSILRLTNVIRLISLMVKPTILDVDQNRAELSDVPAEERLWQDGVDNDNNDYW